jgi:hypothetical protein
MAHAEFQRRQGRTNRSSPQVVRYRDEARLWESCAGWRRFGIRLSNPHSYILKTRARACCRPTCSLAFKREADPQGPAQSREDEPMDGGMKAIDWQGVLRRSGADRVRHRPRPGAAEEVAISSGIRQC